MHHRLTVWWIASCQACQVMHSWQEYDIFSKWLTGGQHRGRSLPSTLALLLCADAACTEEHYHAFGSSDRVPGWHRRCAECYCFTQNLLHDTVLVYYITSSLAALSTINLWYDMLFFIITAFTHQSAIVTHTCTFNCPLPSVLWCCWLGGRRASGLLKTEWWGSGMVICLERGADLHMAQVMPLPLTVSCFSKIQVGLTFLVPAYPGSPGKGAVKWVCVVRDYPDGLVLER